MTEDEVWDWLSIPKDEGIAHPEIIGELTHFAKPQSDAEHILVFAAYLTARHQFYGKPVDQSAIDDFGGGDDTDSGGPYSSWAKE